MSFYAVRVGKIPGIYNTWMECEAQVKGFSSAAFKKFKTKEEALQFIGDAHASNSKDKSVKIYDKEEEAKAKPAPSLKRKLSEKNETTKISKYEKTENMSSKQEKTINKKEVSSSDEEVDRLEDITKISSFDFKNEIVSVYTDGACSKNGRSGASAGVGVFWGVGHPLNVSRKLGGRQTNNRAEITAAIIAIKQAIDHNAKELNLYTDSKFMINCITQWIKKWKINGWKLSNGDDVKNAADLKQLDALNTKIKVHWHYVPGHKGVFGNEQADKLAVGALDS